MGDPFKTSSQPGTAARRSAAFLIGLLCFFLFNAEAHAADLSDIQSSNTVKVVGSDATGTEQTPVQSTTNGAIHSNLRNNAGTEIGTAANPVRVDPTGTTPQPMTIAGLVSTANSTTTPLGSNATFTGTFENVADYATTSITVFSDQASASNGLKFQWSHDCTNVDLEETSDVSASTGRAFQLSQRGKCFRVVYVNGAVAQGTFRLGTTFRVSGSGLISRPLKFAPNGNNFAQLVHSVMAGKREDGTYQDLQVDADGNLVITALTGFGADFTFGDVASSTTTQKVVRRTTYTEQTTNAQRSFSSTDIDDDGSPADTGARTLKVTYLDASGSGPYTETVTLNGTTCVATVATDIAYIEEIEVVTVGSTGANKGTISMFANAACGGGTIGTIPVGENQTFWAHHYVPVGKVANVTGISAGSNSTTVGCGAVFIMKAKKLDATDAVEAQVSDFVRLYGQSSTFARNYQSPIKVSGPARLLLYVKPECSSAITYRASIDFFQP